VGRGEESLRKPRQFLFSKAALPHQPIILISILGIKLI